MKNNIKFETNNSALFIGAGFDCSLGMPNWGELVHMYAGYLKTIYANDKRNLNNKIDIIIKSNFSLMRKISMLDSLLERHTDSMGKNNLRKAFLKANFNYENYQSDIKGNKIISSDLDNFKEAIMKNSNIKIITTNISNTLSSVLGYEPDKNLFKRNSYMPIHGYAFDDHSKILLGEDEYLTNLSEIEGKLIKIMENVSNIIFFGYSMNDFYITRIINGLYDKKITIFLFDKDDNEYWYEIQKDFYERIFNKNNKNVEYTRINNTNHITKLIDNINTKIPSQNKKLKELLEEIRNG